MRNTITALAILAAAPALADERIDRLIDRAPAETIDQIIAAIHARNGKVDDLEAYRPSAPVNVIVRGERPVSDGLTVFGEIGSNVAANSRNIGFGVGMTYSIEGVDLTIRSDFDRNLSHQSVSIIATIQF
jgi:hypothetical protein